MIPQKNKLVLGTVQLGMEYGLNNTSGQPTKEEAFSILDEALASGIDTLDTAWAYGTAEDILGEWMQVRGVAHRVKIISKMKPHALGDHPGSNPVEVVRRELGKSLRRLGVSHLDGYLLHTPEYIHDEAVVAGLREVKAAGLVKHIGVSIYDEADALRAVELGMDYVQIPYNALDQRLDATDFFSMAKDRGTVVFARSPFLQGLLLMDTDAIPEHLRHTRPLVEQFAGIARRHHLSRLEASLLFARGCTAQHVVFGVETLPQLKEVLAASLTETPDGFIEEVRAQISAVDKAIVNPSLWSKIKT